MSKDAIKSVRREYAAQWNETRKAIRNCRALGFYHAASVLRAHLSSTMKCWSYLR